MVSRGTYARGAAQREKILRAAFAALAERGHPKTSLREIARSVDVDSGRIVYYFGSREKLLQEVVLRWDEEAERRWIGGIGPGSIIESYLSTIRHNSDVPGIVRLYLILAAEAGEEGDPSHDFVRDRFERTRTALADGVRHGVSTGRFRTDIDPDDAARTMIALADGLQLQGLVDPTVDAAAALDHYLSTLNADNDHRAEDG